MNLRQNNTQGHQNQTRIMSHHGQGMKQYNESPLGKILVYHFLANLNIDKDEAMNKLTRILYTGYLYV